jgi:hypothetical protein
MASVSEGWPQLRSWTIWTGCFGNRPHGYNLGYGLTGTGNRELRVDLSAYKGRKAVAVALQRRVQPARDGGSTT